jgi:diguanylate cyclase (GGDEF)-like protein/PAS domain S-box-containing protein
MMGDMSARRPLPDRDPLSALALRSCDLYIVLDEDATVTYAAPSVEQILGFSIEEFVGTTFTRYVHADDQEALRRHLDVASSAETRLQLDIRMHRKDGTGRWFDTVILNLKSDRQVAGMALIQRDVTERRRHEGRVLRPVEGLEDDEERYRSLVEHVPAIVYLAGFGERGAWHYVSPQVEAMLGFTPEEWIDGILWYQQLHPEDRARVLWEEERDLESGVAETVHSEYRLIAKDGRVVWVRDESAIVWNDSGQPLYYRGVMFDITDRMALEEQLTHQAFHDPLTKLPNRALFYNRVEHALARRDREITPLAILFIDLDDFKGVNDAFGHSIGDQLLMQIATNLRRSLRAGDTAARFGGDEFAVLLENADPERTAHIAQRILDTFDEPVLLGDKEMRISGSVGAVVSTTRNEDVESLVANADAAMYRAKMEGKARYVLFDPQVQEEVASRRQLKRDLGAVVVEGQLDVHYQPIVSLMTGAVSGAEALVRWAHPDRGLLLPELFVEPAEETGAIIPIGAWVLTQACKQAKEWSDRAGEGMHLSMHVNLSSRQLQHPGVVDQVASALEEAGLPPERLIVEITESAVLSDWRAAGVQVGRLRELGVLVALDDFGTGYSSLSYLQRFPVDVLKIDRSFVRAISRDREGFRLTRAIIHLADTLQLVSIAEGIELPEELVELRAVGCPLGQGFYLSRPQPASQLDELFRKGFVPDWPA